MRIFIFLLLAILTYSSCSDDGSSAQALRLEQSIKVQGIVRTFLINLPGDYYDNDADRALVIGLHGAGGSGLQFEKDYELQTKVNGAGAIAVFPDGVNSTGPLKLRFWNAGNCCDYSMEQNIDDVGFIRTLLTHLTDTYRIDESRIFVAGMSNGGMFAYRLACEMSERFAAIAVVSGTLMVSEPCDATTPVPVLHLHSIKDEKVPFAGGKGLGGYNYTPVELSVQTWSAINGCAQPMAEEDYGLYSVFRSEGCLAPVQLYVTEDGGHAWPGSKKARHAADEPSVAINGNDVIWNFFSEHVHE
ncbi:alpha/beta hydrolase family esterase [Chryseosolibacter indicus]|uniref:Phospholipase n=1 Tax=Chryseosolibacter indicus TaxID=2782351 RepID=A0ABS5VTA0_9BACT|nr:PHB depolymerase family esterase [Chryseosolibacter indicus]MBT1704426.1 phospholipase [Chryseosolibacter indicus]